MKAALLLEGFLHQIPFVHDHDDRFFLLDGLTRDRLVLLRDPVHRVQYEENHIGILDRIEGTQAGKIFDRRRQLRSCLDPGRIDQAKRIFFSVAAGELKS